MSRLEIFTPDRATLVIEDLYRTLDKRIEASPPGLCPVDITRAFIEMCHSQTCGKCVPCRVGLLHLKHMMTTVLNGNATMDIIPLIEETAKSISETADCAIGYEAANMVYKTVTTCGFICEHPCEEKCRRNMVDDAINIRGIKRVAADMAGKVPPPPCAPSTGKKIAVIGGGPSGLSAAYYLQLMGHQTTVFEMLPKLGGMLRYGIPNYRLPKDRLEEDVDAILATGVEVKYGLKLGVDLLLPDLKKEYDSLVLK